MPAIDTSTASDLNATFSASAGAAFLHTAAGTAPPGLPFGDVLTNSISSTPNFGSSPTSATPFGPASANRQSANAQFGDPQFSSSQFGNNQFGNTQFGNPQFGSNQSPVGQSGSSRSNAFRAGNSQTDSSQSASTQTAPSQPTITNAPPAGDSQKPPAAGDNAAPPSPPGNGGTTDQSSLLAASLSGANQASSAQFPPANSTGDSTSKTAKSAADRATGAGDAPAQLVSNLLRAEIANGNMPGASKNAATQNAQNNGAENSGSVNAPHALLAGLQQAVEQSTALANRSPGDPSAQPASAVDPIQNPVPATGKGPAPQASASNAAGTTAITMDAAHLASLIQTSTTAAANGAPQPPAAVISSDSNSSGKQPGQAAAAVKVSSASQVALPATGAATGSGNSPTSSPADSNAAAGILGGNQLAGQAVPGQNLIGQPIIGQQVAEQQPGGQQTGAVAVVGKTVAADAGMQAAALAAAPADSSATSLSLTPNLASGPGVSSTTSFDTGNLVQPTNANNGSQTAQSPGTQAPGSQTSGTQPPSYLLFGAAPPSLQLHVMSSSSGQTAPSASLTSAVLDQAAYAVQYSHSNGQQMQLHLNPPELGALQVNVSMHDGVLSARIEAQTPTAQQILTDNISQLKDSLTQQGVSFDRIDVHLAGTNTGSGGAGTADRSFAQQRDGGHSWNQQFVQPENDDAALQAPVRAAQTSRAPMTSLDIMI